MTRKNTAADFWRFVEKSDGCWNWTGHVTGRRYGGFKMNGVDHRAHRFSWELHNGSVPSGFVVRHVCDNPLCVRPDHLLIGTQADNVADMDFRNRRVNASGLRNGLHTHPETRMTGDKHWSKKYPDRTLKGEQNAKSKLTSEQVIEIRAAYQYGSSTHGSTALGRLYGVTSTSILDIVRGNHWKHLKEHSHV